MSTHIKCIGGPLDGEWYDAFPNLHKMEVTDPIFYISDYTKIHTYTKEILRLSKAAGGIGDEVVYWLHESVAKHTLLGILLSGYREPKKKGGPSMRTKCTIELRVDTKSDDTQTWEVFEGLLRDSAKTLYTLCTMMATRPPTIEVSVSNEVLGTKEIELFPEETHVEDYSDGNR